MRQPEPSSVEPAHVPTRSLRRRLSPQAVKELVARYTAGESIRALSMEHGVSRSGLCQLLLGEGVVLRRLQGITLENTNKVVRLYESGLTIRQVVAQVGYSYGTIRMLLHQNAVDMRSGGREVRAASDT